MIQNEQILVRLAELKSADDLGVLLREKLGRTILRWYVAGVRDSMATIEATTTGVESAASKLTESTELRSTRSCVVSIIPTGIACEFGGYAGDASCVTSLLAQCADYVITNPNALNGSDFIGPLDKVLYTEGSCIDLLAEGRVNLWVPAANRIGVVIERADAQELNVVFNVINAVRAIHGVDIVDCVVTDQRVGSTSIRNPSGAYVGTIENPATLLRACDRLVQAGASAIAVTTRIEGLSSEVYAEHFAGLHPNPMGGVESILSHLVVARYALPAAHAPMINVKGAKDYPNQGSPADKLRVALRDEIVDPRAAGELVSTSGLACVLMGLKRAPQIRADVRRHFVDVVNVQNVVAVVAPASALGGAAAIHCAGRGVPIVAVEANRTLTSVSGADLELSGVVHVRNYAEAAGVLLALRHGIALDGIARPMKRFTHETRSSVATSGDDAFGPAPDHRTRTR